MLNLKLLARLLLILAFASGPTPPTSARIQGPFAVDTLIVPIIGDSNNGSGQFFDATYDTSVAGIFQLKQNFTVVQAREPLDQISMGLGDVGPTTKLVQLLVANGHLLSGVTRVVILPTAWAGTGMNPVGNNAWNVAKGGCCGRLALDGNGSNVTGLLPMINKAKQLWPKNRIWFWQVIIGANDGGASQVNETTWIQQLFSELRRTYPSDASAPAIFTGIPPDLMHSLLGSRVNLGNVSAALQKIGSFVSNAYYVDPTGLPSYLNNAFFHYSAAAHRGGTENYSKTPRSVSISSGSYNSGTGLVTLTLPSDVFAAPGSSVTVSGATGTGSFSGINGTFTAGPGTGGTTLSYMIATGLTMTITNSGRGAVTCNNCYNWNATTNYVYPGAYISKTVVIASDGYLYSCIANNTNKDPAGNTQTSFWTQIRPYVQTFSDMQSLAGKQYTVLLSAGL